MTKICRLCKNEKDIKEFSVKKKDSNGIKRQTDCKECKRKYNKEHYKNNKDYYLQKNKKMISRNRENFLEYLKDKCCKDCKNSDIRVLEFDHLHDKKTNISNAIKEWSWERTLTEIEKCDIVCCNCHRIRTLERANSYRNICSGIV